MLNAIASTPAPVRHGPGSGVLPSKPQRQTVYYVESLENGWKVQSYHLDRSTALRALRVLKRERPLSRMRAVV